jgi:hypothetical protein
MYKRKKMKKKDPVKAGYQSRIKLWPMVEYAKKFFWHHHHTTSTAQSGEERSRHKELHAVAAVFRQITITVKGITL